MTETEDNLPRTPRCDKHRVMSEKAEKSNKLKARLPRRLADRGPGEIAATRAMIAGSRNKAYLA